MVTVTPSYRYRHSRHACWVCQVTLAKSLGPSFFWAVMVTFMVYVPTCHFSSLSADYALSTERLLSDLSSWDLLAWSWLLFYVIWEPLFFSSTGHLDWTCVFQLPSHSPLLQVVHSARSHGWQIFTAFHGVGLYFSTPWIRNLAMWLCSDQWLMSGSDMCCCQAEEFLSLLTWCRATLQIKFAPQLSPEVEVRWWASHANKK